MNLSSNNFESLSQEELLDIDGGLAPVIIAGIILGGICVVGLGVGIYVGYKEAEAANK